MTTFWSKTVRIGLLTLFSFTGGVVAAEAAAASPPEQSPYSFLRQLARVLVLVENEYVEPVDRNRLLEGSIKGMVAELDPHSAYLAPEDYKIFQSDTKGEFGGIGVEVDFRNEMVTVIAPIEGSPAERAGIKPGDRIIAIDNQPVRGKATEDLIRTMRGAPGTKVVLLVQRDGIDRPLTFGVTREVIEVASITGQALEGDVGYIRIKQFQTGTHTELLEAIGDLRQTIHGRLKGVLLDLRNNPGGLVDEATAVADEFLQEGLVYTTRRRGQTVDEVRAQRGGAVTSEPLVVLVNEFSASAAELVAGALQDHRRATIVGMPTFGKGSVQTIIDLPEGAGLRLTTMRYYTPNGHAIQAQGIQPDVRVEAAYATDKSFGVVKESDLENHLPAEGMVDVPVPRPEPADQSVTDEETHLGVAREVPKNPTGGPDFALSIGYQIVRGVLKR